MEEPRTATIGWHLLLMLVTSLVTLLWDGIPFFNQHLLQVRHMVVLVTLAQLWFNGVEVWTAGKPFHPLHSLILEVVSDKPLSVGVSVVILDDIIWSHPVEVPVDCQWFQNFTLISLCIEIASNDKSHFSPVRAIPPNTITLPPPKSVFSIISTS